MFLFFCIALQPLFAGREILLRGKTYNLSRLGPEKLNDFSLAEQRLLASYLIEYGVQYYDDRQRRQLLQRLEEGSDPVLRTLAAVGRAYFFHRTLSGRLAELQVYRNRPLEASILDFHIALTELSQGKFSAEKLLAICKLPAENASCRLAHFLAALESPAKQSGGDLAAIKELLVTGQSFLSGDPLFPAFFRLQARRICDELYRSGLPLEAALLADRLTHGEDHFDMKELQRQIPVYLAGSGDFSSAARFAARTHPQSTLLDLVRLDWLILAGEYNEALNLIAARGPEKLIRTGYVDYWTRFPVSAEGNRLKAAMLLYLNGQARDAAVALEKIKDFKGKTPEGEPEAMFARLRLVQMIMRDNPALAQKIAEDISYEAQEHGWDILEYQATVLDGWARYFQKEYYKAIINFQKSQGIVKGEKRRLISDYSRLLGIFAARRAMAPAGNHRPQIASLNAFLQRHPYHESIYILRDWLIAGLGPEFLAREVALTHQARRDGWGALNAMLEFERVAASFFPPGRNPGGFRGFDTSMRWIQNLLEMQAPRALFGTIPQPGSLARTLAQERSAEPTRVHVQPNNLRPGSAYLFTFPRHLGRTIVSLLPSGRAHSVLVEELGVQEERALRACRSPCTLRPPGGRVLSAERLLVQYDADFDPDWSGYLSYSGRPVYFVHATQRHPGRGFSGDFLTVGGCAVPPGFRSQSISFEALLASGDLKPALWLWPPGLDRRVGSRQSERPVYLRNFLCGRSQLRFWDLDRFHSGRGPGYLAYRLRAGEAALDQAFARHFADRGTTLLELWPGWSSRHSEALLPALRNQNDLLELSGRGEAGRQLRLILPDMFD
ncbi:MAG: hypothetical protein HS115_05640 [Spirochaetales bacterium]|nr:hypothetical protein [Spirochaetales bacterium]